MYKFLIYISYTYALPIGEPLEEAIVNRGYTVKWFSDLKESGEALNSKNNSIKTLSEVIEYNPHIVLTITDNVPDFIPGLKVQIFHGFLAQKRVDRNKMFSHFRLRGFFDLYCTQGPSTTKVFKQLSEKHKYFEVIETGWSKVDPLFPLEKEPDKAKPVVFIASTFTEKLSLAHDETVFEEIKKLSKSGKYSFLMTLHPKIKPDLILKWKSLENENFKFYDTTQLIPLFKKSNIMFSDTTSAIQEYLLQGKPVVAYRHNNDHDYLIHVNAASNIEDGLKNALSPSKEFLEKIRDFVEELHPYYDGKSSQRVIDACIAQLHKNKDHLKNKPLNLIRKYKIRKRLGYFTLKSYNKPYTFTRIDIKN